MTVREGLLFGYDWLFANADMVLLSLLAVPIILTLVVWVSKRWGRPSEFATITRLGLMGLLGCVIVEAILIAVAIVGFGVSMLDADIRLLIAPPLVLAISWVGLRSVAPMAVQVVERSVRAGLILAVMVAALLWLLQKFHGWGIAFFGSVDHLMALIVICVIAMRAMWRRIFRDVNRPWPR